MAIVYQHRRLDTNEIFYIGIGKSNKRAHSKYDRSMLWNRYVNKFGYYVEILHENISWEDACNLEIFYIKKYGRINNSTGILVNLTNGGDGIKGYSHTNETKELLRKLKTGNKLTAEHIAIIKLSNTGRKHTQETLHKMSVSQLGEKNHMWGKNGTAVSNSKLSSDKVIWIRTNYIKNDLQFGIRPMARKFDVSRTTIKNVINYKLWKNP
jgi:group I intron endonuclease